MPDFLLNYYVIYILLIAAFIFSIFASVNVKSTFRKYNRMPSSMGKTAAQVAREILDSNGLYNVQVGVIHGELTDNYNPKTNTVSLSSSVYNSTSVGAIGVAAHEVGHAIQYAQDYFPIKIRMAILPFAQLGSSAWMLFFILGIVFDNHILRGVGIILFAAIVLFQLITLPVEFNASRRALSTIKNQGFLYGAEYTGAKKTLTAAAMTYVASLAVALLQLLRLIANSRRR
ncbi:MAG: zinc metallopeptidase [Ruminiclostridium sp.]